MSAKSHDSVLWIGTYALVLTCICLSLSLVLVTMRPMETLYGGSAVCKNDVELAHDVPPQIKLKVIPEWQAAAVVEDRDYERLNDLTYGVPRRLVPMGTATFLFVHFSTYRVGPKSFAITGLSARDLLLHSNPGFLCSWHPNQNLKGAPIHRCNGTIIQSNPRHISYGRQYTGTVVLCNFTMNVGTDGFGGHLEVTATHGTRDRSGLEDVNFVAQRETPWQYNKSHFQEPYQYDHVYCGYWMHGAWINPQRLREWIAYHVKFFGERSHFFLYDAGAIGNEIRRVLQPWVDLGRVTISNIRQQERYSTHYHNQNQFLILSDCMLRSRTLSKWTWFFNTDEYIYIPSSSHLNEVIESIERKNFSPLGKRLQRVWIQQNPMDCKHCQHTEDSQQHPSEWAMEKLVYRRTEHIENGGQMDRKSFVRSDSVLAMGPHEPPQGAYILPAGATNVRDVTEWTDSIVYYHYQGLSGKDDQQICQELVDTNTNVTSFDDVVLKTGTYHNVSHQLDFSMKVQADDVKEFERRMLGSATAK